MKARIVLVTLCLCLCAVPVFAGPAEDAAQAYAVGDYARARSLWLTLAEQGDPRAMNNLGVLYDEGRGVPEDAAEAARWFQKAAAGGHPAGMSNYGRMLEKGRGVPSDVTQAAQWFRQAAEQGVAEAQYNLGLLHERGQGVAKSEKDAATWYSMAAAGQQVDAQARLGQFYRDGKGVRKNATRAVLLLYGAAMEGHAEAMKDLAAMAVRKGKNSPRAVLFGVDLARANREALREALAKAKIPAVREDAEYICDVYDVRQAVPGASEMAACYGPAAGGAEQPLAFVKVDYAAPDKKQAERIRGMVSGRFGAPAAGEGTDAALWNLGEVIVATQYAPDAREVGLMYMVPRVYHLARHVEGNPQKK